MAVRAVRRVLAGARQSVPLLDHTVRAVRHYSAHQGSSLAAAVTYFAFLSFFPLLTLAFAAVGLVAELAPDAQSALDESLRDLLPGMVGDGAGQLSLTEIQGAAGAAAGLGLVALLYAGLGWTGEMRKALTVVFETRPEERPSFLRGQLRDLRSLLVLGVLLLLSALASATLARFPEEIGLEEAPTWLAAGLSLVSGAASGMLLFYALFRLLARPRVPHRALWSGAVVGTVGFELLKQVSQILIAMTSRQAAFQVFGVALILLVWISYSSRLVVFAAAWTTTAQGSRRDA